MCAMTASKLALRSKKRAYEHMSIWQCAFFCETHTKYVVSQLIYYFEFHVFSFRLTNFLLIKVRRSLRALHHHRWNFVEWHFNWRLSTSNCKNNIRMSRNKTNFEWFLKGKRDFMFSGIRKECSGFDAFREDSPFFTHAMFWPKKCFTGSLKNATVEFRRLPSQQILCALLLGMMYF